ncbi:MAG: ABC transporter substrate-binding protein [Clostridia bacterium]|nr:ABC transporter substrate-binding protein [Clostridia bacterium]
MVITMIKKFLSLFLALVMLFSFSACQENVKNSPTEKKSEKTEKKESIPINLLYNKADSLNPYTCVTDNNRNLCKLVFEPLVKTDNNFKPILRVAKSVKLSGKTCTVTLKNANFSDGTTLSAKDVIFSYNLAKNSKSIYSSHLYEVKSVSSDSSKTVIFNLTKKDPYFKNLLDFPIIKKGSTKRTNSDGVALPPIGCGRYYVNFKNEKLLLNKHFFGKKSSIKEINLINAPDNNSISHYIEIGATELYYNDLSSNNIIRMSGKKAEVNLNDFVYLGVNQQSSGLSSKYLRYAISSAIDRNAICSNVYFNNATPASGYFNPNISEIKAVQSIKPTSDNEITVENLNKIGYNNTDSDGYYTNSKGKRLVLRLLVSKENRYKVAIANLIKSQLKTAGIEIKVVSASYSEYKKSLKSNSFDLYLGEMSVLPNFDVSELVLQGGKMAYGVKPPKEKVQKTDKSKDKETETKTKNKKAKNITATSKKVINNFYNGICSLSDVASTLLTEMPQIPILYRKGLFFYKDNIKSGVKSCECDIYYSIEDYVTE